jgi:dTDP-4-dehydrorhamnose reductase
VASTSLVSERRQMWLLVGGDSEVGAATGRYIERLGRPFVATTRRAISAAGGALLLDLSAPLDAWEPPEGISAACIFAAVARLAACHADPIGTARINVIQTIALIERLVARGIFVLFLSTNQVFDGSTPGVAADSKLCPVSEYGRQKARVERALFDMMTKGAPLAVLRLAKVLSPDMALLHKWLDALSAGQSIAAFHDMTMAPVPVDMVAAAIAALLDERASGIFQLTGPRDVAYLEIGRHLARRIGAAAALVAPISAASAGLPEGSTPRHTTLDSRAMSARYGISAPEPWNAIAAVEGAWCRAS